jgi:hypothetical protein
MDDLGMISIVMVQLTLECGRSSAKLCATRTNYWLTCQQFEAEGL